MAWLRIEKPKTVLARRDLIDEFVNMKPVPHDRPLSERRMMVYERILRNQEFRTVVWASVMCFETGEVMRVNGKHTSLLLSKQDPIPDFHVTVERYQADTLKDVANLYNTFDSSLASRTTADINMAFAATVPELAKIPPKFINLAVSAAAFHEYDEHTRGRVPPAEKAELLLDIVTFVQWLNRFFPKSHPRSREDMAGARPLNRSPVVTAMLATYRQGPIVSTRFWEAVRDETADKGDPTRTLAKFLTSVVMAGGRGSAGRAVGFNEVYAKCIHAYNAWRRNEPLERLNYFANAELPKPEK